MRGADWGDDPPRFICDVHLGKLARYLRMIGFDTLYDRELEDGEIIRLALAENRTVLTRDGGILADGRVGSYRPLSNAPERQITEVINDLSLQGYARPFTLCLTCNGLLLPVDKETLGDLVPPAVRRVMDEFHRCSSCRRIFWPGTHYDHMAQRIGEWLSLPDAGRSKHKGNHHETSS